MKITGGTLRGREIIVNSRADLRPSQSRVREAIFNIIPELNDKLIMDLFAGTGILGIEALSRGAHYVDFVEKNPQGSKDLHTVLSKLQIDSKADVYCDRVETVLTRYKAQKYDVVFLDPPYRQSIESILPLLEHVLVDDGLIVYLHSAHPSSAISPETYQSNNLFLSDQRKYGDTVVDFITHNINTSIK
ncbi:16S rRNA (guanine(966)-N(2))-methyltransferase RsmD [candidate division WWE3 bacterium]|nr:16S rRNA (guanine(966)-N(2))-methyltransferase RsmD [candidate division WWE3 bacterium]